MQKPIILVTGATGAQGGSVARSVIEFGKFHVRCLTRDASSSRAEQLRAAGAEVVEGDLDDKDSLIRAMKGCYGVFGITNFWEHFGKEMQQGRNLIDAVYESGVQHFVFSTLPSYKKLSNGAFEVPHCDIKAELEDYSRSLDLNATYVRVAFYYENFYTFFPFQKKEDGNYYFGFPQGDTKLSMVSTDDLGPIVSKIFENREEYVGRVVGVVGEDRTCAEYAETISEVFGEKVIYQHIPRDVYASFGFPGAEELANMFEVQRLYVPSRQKDLEESNRLNPKMQSLETWLRNNKEKFSFMHTHELAEA